VVLEGGRYVNVGGRLLTTEEFCKSKVHERSGFTKEDYAEVFRNIWWGRGRICFLAGEWIAGDDNARACDDLTRL